MIATSKPGDGPHSQVKTAPDETRMLVLGCQVLLGFQFQSVFQEGFRQLAEEAKAAEALALLLMTAAVGLLIAPGTYHMVVKSHAATRHVPSSSRAVPLGTVALWNNARRRDLRLRRGTIKSRVNRARWAIREMLALVWSPLPGPPIYGLAMRRNVHSS